MGLGGAAVLGLGAMFVVWGLYNALTMWLPEGEWWVVLSRLITALAAAGAAGVVVWMMQRPGKAAVGDET